MQSCSLELREMPNGVYGRPTDRYGLVLLSRNGISPHKRASRHQLPNRRQLGS